MCSKLGVDQLEATSNPVRVISIDGPNIKSDGSDIRIMSNKLSFFHGEKKEEARNKKNERVNSRTKRGMQHFAISTEKMVAGEKIKH